MAVDKLVDSSQLDSDLNSVANAILNKSGGTGPIAFPSGFVSEIQAIPSGGTGIQWDLIGTYTTNLAEYTDTTTSQTIDTGINIKNTDYNYFTIIITCDSTITTTSEWGMTMANGGRYKSNSAFMNGTSVQQKGSATLSYSAMTTNSLMTTAYGVSILNNTNNITFSRKCHSTGCPKIRGGNYTVKVYGLKSL